MDSDKGPVVFPLLTLGEVFHVKILFVIFVIISLHIIFLGCILLTPNRLNQQGKIFSLVFISQQVVSEPSSIVWVLWLVLV